MVANVLHAAAGIAGLLLIAWLASERRRAVPWRAVGPDGDPLAAGLYILRLHDASGRMAIARAVLVR